MKLYLFLMLFTVLSWFPRVKKTDMTLLCHWTSQVAQVVKNSPDNAGDKRDTGSIPGLERSPGEGNGNPLQYSCLENPMDRGAWRATVHGVAKSWSQLKQLRSSIMPLIIFNVFLQSNVLEINFLVCYNIISASLYCCCSVCLTPWDPMDWLQHARLPCPLPCPGACSNSCPLSWWCHPTISSSVIPFYSCLQSFPASGSFLMS